MPLVPPRSRYPELDSVRGIAAVSVVLYHFARVFEPVWVSDGNLLGLVLHPLLGGHEAVLLFFLLSGLVLSISYLRGKGQRYPAFLLRRVVRLYGPYLAALLLSILGATLFHGRPVSATIGSTWRDPVTVHAVAQHLLLLGHYTYDTFNIAFWSLVYEMRISLVFPALFLLIHRLRPRAALALAAGLTLLAQQLSSRIPAYDTWFVTLSYTAIFIIGIVMASRLDLLHTWYHRRGIASRAIFGAFSVLCYTHGPLLARIDRVGLWRLAEIVPVLGAAGLLLIAMNAPSVRTLLDHPALLFLGRISFSLYLTHSILLFVLASLVHGHPALAWALPLYLAASLATATVFWLFIEDPCTHGSQRLGQWLDRKLDRTSGRALGPAEATATEPPRRSIHPAA